MRAISNDLSAPQTQHRKAGRSARSAVVALGLAALTMTAVQTVAFPDGAQAALPLVDCTTSSALFSSGHNPGGGQLPAGSIDPNWVAAGPVAGVAAAPPPAGLTYGAAYAGKTIGTWAASRFGNAEWISAEPPGPVPATITGSWYYKLPFTLAPGVDPARFALAFDLYADNSVVEVFVNGVPQSGNIGGLPQAPAGDDPAAYSGFAPENVVSATLAHGWQTGANELVVQTASLSVNGIGGFEGFLAEIQQPSLVCPVPQFSVAKTVSAPTAAPGSVLTYSVTVTNTGNYPGSAASFTDDIADALAAGTYNNDASDGATYSGTTVSWTGPLAVGESRTITYSVTTRPSATGTIDNTVIPGVGGVCAPSGCTATTSLLHANANGAGDARATLAATGTDSGAPLAAGILAALMLALGSGFVLARYRRMQ